MLCVNVSAVCFRKSNIMLMRIAFNSAEAIVVVNYFINCPNLARKQLNTNVASSEIIEAAGKQRRMQSIRA